MKTQIDKRNENTQQDNATLAQQLESLKFCMADLAKRNLRIADAKLIAGVDRPVIRLKWNGQERPRGFEWAWKGRRLQGGIRTARFVAIHQDCQIEMEVQL